MNPFCIWSWNSLTDNVACDAPQRKWICIMHMIEWREDAAIVKKQKELIGNGRLGAAQTGVWGSRGDVATI